MPNIGVFIDRDGTISEEVGYINHVSRFQVYPWSPDAIRSLNQIGLRAILVTNQAGVARGYFKESMIEEVHQKLRNELGKTGAFLDAIYYCPHHPSAGVPPYRMDCNCRKPKPGMLLRAASEFEIDLSQSYVIGDRYSDIELARNAGSKAIFVLSGYGLGEYEYQRQHWIVQPDWIARDLQEATEIILRQYQAAFSARKIDRA
ncbi:MAG: HAD family hydrolase [Terriglobia bacterium]